MGKLVTQCGIVTMVICVLYLCYFHSQRKRQILPGEKKVPRNESIPITAINMTSLSRKHVAVSYHDSSRRLGSELKFDYKSCPPGSYMVNKDQEFVPEHQDCPALFIVGARKGGTTSLIQYLSKHPDFKGPKLDKGPQAGETWHFTAGYKSSWRKYVSLFPRGKMSGDSSVTNLVHSDVPKRLYKTCGQQAKVVMLFRDPIQRMQSNLLMRIRLHSDGMNSSSPLQPVVAKELESFLKAVPKRSVTAASLLDKWSMLVGKFPPSSNMLYEGLYYVHLLNWLCNFPAENILIFNSEEFFHSPSKILDSVVQFLGLRRLDPETYDNITSVSYNSVQKEVPDYQKLSQSDRETLSEIFQPFNQALVDLLQWDNSLWNI